MARNLVTQRSARTLSRHLALVACLLAGPLSATEVDPTRPLGHTPSTYKKTSGLNLSSILYSSDRRVAVINDKLVHEGDRVGGAKIIKIMEDRVQIEVNGKRRELKLNPTIVKRATGHAGK